MYLYISIIWMLQDKLIFCLYSEKYFLLNPPGKSPCLWPRSTRSPVRILNSLIQVWHHLSAATSGVSFKSARFCKDVKIAIALSQSLKWTWKNCTVKSKTKWPSFEWNNEKRLFCLSSEIAKKLCVCIF